MGEEKENGKGPGGRHEERQKYEGSFNDGVS